MSIVTVNQWCTPQLQNEEKREAVEMWSVKRFDKLTKKWEGELVEIMS